MRYGKKHQSGKFRRLIVRSVRRSFRRRRGRNLAMLSVAVLALTAAGTVMVYQMRHTTINPAAYVPLLNTIAQGESNGNYNAYFGNSGNVDIRFTDMTIEQVLQWQQQYVQQGSVSNAVGRYQIIQPTLQGLVQSLGIRTDARFDSRLQDRMAIALLERRGSIAFVNKTLTREQFAANIAKEWAALPRVLGPDPDESYYAGDGINTSRISISQVYGALGNLKK